jgi:AraC-like DNA-binding protein
VTSGAPTAPPHPSTGQRAWEVPGLDGVVRCSGPAVSYQDNIHLEMKLVMATGGPFEVRRRGRRFVAQSGELLMLHPDEAHSGRPLGRGVTWELLCLPPRLFRRPMRREVPVLPSRTAHKYVELLGLLDEPLPATVKEVAVRDFALSLERWATPLREPTTVAVAAAYAKLAENLDRKVTLSELAEASGTTPSSIARAFRRELGMPPHTIHLRLRLAKAQESLRAGRPPSEVAQIAGFSDQAHLTRRFTKLYGISPRRYQRELGIRTRG